MPSTSSGSWTWPNAWTVTFDDGAELCMFCTPMRSKPCRPCTTSTWCIPFMRMRKQACSGPTTATRPWFRGARRTVWPLLSIRTTASSVVFRTETAGRTQGMRGSQPRCLRLPSGCRASLATSHGRPSPTPASRPACCRTDQNPEKWPRWPSPIPSSRSEENRTDGRCPVPSAPPFTPPALLHT